MRASLAGKTSQDFPSNALFSCHEVWFAHVRSVENNIFKYQTPIDSSTLWRYVTIIPGKIAFFFLKHDMQNCCLVTLTCWTEFLVSLVNTSDIFYTSVLFWMLFSVLVYRLALLCSYVWLKCNKGRINKWNYECVPKGWLMKSLVWQQNRHQKVLCSEALH